MACSRSCSRILGVSLGLSALFAAGANLALFFPDWEVTSLRNGLIGKHALRGSGLWGGGLMVFLASILISLVGWRQGCFRNSGACKSMLVSLLASCLAFFGAFVCFITSGAALKNGPFCMFDVSWSNETQASKYGYPFQDLTDRNYLYDRFLWDSVCLEPSRAVIWHVTFFSTLLGVSVLQIMLVLVQVINSFLGFFCGFFEKREVFLSVFWLIALDCSIMFYFLCTIFFCFCSFHSVSVPEGPSSSYRNPPFHHSFQHNNIPSPLDATIYSAIPQSRDTPSFSSFFLPPQIAWL